MYGISNVHPQVVIVELYWKLLGEWLYCFLVVLGALMWHMEMMALVLNTVERAIFETHHNHHGHVHIIAMVAYNLEILHIHWCLLLN